jgi:ATP/maltotriose-dependent transcriptional regulator MalT
MSAAPTHYLKELCAILPSSAIPDQSTSAKRFNSRATAAAAQNQVETIIAQSRRALEYLHPDNLAVRTATIWKLGYAYHLQGDRVAASRAYTDE